MWQCRSPRMSLELDQLAAAVAVRAPPPARRGPRAARARCRRGRAARRPPASVAHVRVRAGRVVEHAVLGDVQARAAPRASRSAALCAPEPVKCCSRLPSCAGLDDPQVDADARVGARPRARRAGRADALDLLELGEALGERRRVASVDGDQVDVLDAVGQRRAEPATSTCVPAPPCSRRPATSASPSSSALGSSTRGRRARSARRPLERGEHVLLELRAEPLHVAQPLRLAPPRAAPRASRCRARRVQQARALRARGRAAA